MRRRLLFKLVHFSANCCLHKCTEMYKHETPKTMSGELNETPKTMSGELNVFHRATDFACPDDSTIFHEPPFCVPG